jgi:probable HAF family extracellular repeat protein
VSGNIIVGDSRPLGDTDTGQRAFAYDLGVASPKMRDLGTLGGTTSGARAVSGNIVVGTSSTAAGPISEHAFAYDLMAANPKMRDLGTLGGPVSNARAVSGTIVVGEASTASGTQHAFACDLGAAFRKMRDLGTLGGIDSRPEAVSGTIIVGKSATAAHQSHAFAYDLGAASPKMRDLGAFPVSPDPRWPPGAGVSSEALAVNGTIVVGISMTTAHQQHAFAYDLGAPSPTMRDLGTLGGIDSRPEAVSGTIIVGSSSTEPGSCSRGGPEGCGRHAFAYNLTGASPEMRDLGVLGGTGTSQAVAVSGNIIVGVSTTPDGNDHAVAWKLAD